MATEQLVLIVATILRRVRLRNLVASYQPRLDARLVLRPRGPVWMKILQPDNQFATLDDRSAGDIPDPVSQQRCK